MLHDWTGTKFIFALSRDWITFLPLRKTLSTFHSPLCRFLKRFDSHCFIVLDIELADKNLIEELGHFIIGNVQRYSFRPPRKYKPTKQAVWCTKEVHRYTWNCGPVNYSELPNIIPSDLRGDCYAEERKILGKLMGKEAENLEDHGCPKDKDLGAEEMWICSS